MSIYTVHEPPLRAAEALPDPERFVFVRDGFYFWAFALTPVWMLWHRMWIVLLIYAIVAIGVDNVMHAVGIGVAGVSLAELFISFLIGIEASTLWRFTLARRGFKNVGVVAGDSIEAAERRFFDALAGAAAAKQTAPATVSQTAPPDSMPTAPPPPGIVGLFPEPGMQW